jgi:hypothetical protein
LRGACFYDGWKTGSTFSIGILTDWLCCIGKNSGTTPNNILFEFGSFLFTKQVF